ncbi:MAG TPA: plastocyanin/azurin family copper-binding protein [Gemmatimonadales bacterium]
MALAIVAAACFSSHEPDVLEGDFDCARAGQPAGPDSAIVIIRGFAYEPAALTVAPGTRVVWINCEPEGTPGHTTTAESDAWDSPTLAPGDVFSTDAPAEGVHEYFCRPHPFIRGQLTVAASAAQRSGRLTRR